jgi:hypothetical protein
VHHFSSELTRLFAATKETQIHARSGDKSSDHIALFQRGAKYPENSEEVKD